MSLRKNLFSPIIDAFQLVTKLLCSIINQKVSKKPRPADCFKDKKNLHSQEGLAKALFRHIPQLSSNAITPTVLSAS